MFMLLGKTQMKAKQFKEATESFEQALSLYVSYVHVSCNFCSTNMMCHKFFIKLTVCKVNLCPAEPLIYPFLKTL